MEQPQRGTYQDDEISLVDLAKILIRRRWWLLGTGGVIFLLALAFALLSRGDPVYQYTSIYQQAETEPGRALTSSESVIQQVENLYWPSFQRNYKEENNVRELPFDLATDNPDDTTLIIMRTTATENDQNKVVNLHEALLEKVTARQNELLEREKSNLENSIERVSTLLERVESSDSESSVEMAANYSDQLFELESQLERLTKGEVIENVVKGSQQTPSLNSKVILTLGILLSFFTGIIAAFTVEFIAKVRESLETDKEIS